MANKRNKDLSVLATGAGFNVKVKVIPKNSNSDIEQSARSKNRISQT